MSEQFGFGNQIVDITKECTFEWHQEPASCCAFLEVSGASGDFTEGETVTGQNSGATASVFSSYVDGGRVYVTDVSGTFEAGETISGSSSNQTATVDGFVPERSWTSTPNNITQGTFPDSIISKNIDDYLEWESTLPGSNNVAHLRIIPPNNGWYVVSPIVGSGEDVNGVDTVRGFYFRARDRSIVKGYISDPKFFNGIFPTAYCPTFSFVYLLGNSISYSDENSVFLSPYQNDKGTFRWRIHNIRVLKLVI